VVEEVAAASADRAACIISIKGNSPYRCFLGN
jgi:hypothetical protein